MRIAILADIHGNLVALDAVLGDLESQSPDEVWCGGDIAWGGPWPAECIDRVREAGWPTVKGNTDIWVAGDAQGLPAGITAEDIEVMVEAHALAEDDALWLLNLPLGHTGPGSILLVHATPETPFDAPEPDAPPNAFAPYQTQAQNVVYGHVHRAFIRRLADGTLVVNPGSVGAPLDDKTASYMVLDRHGTDWVFTHRRVTFDRRRVVEESRRRDDPVGNWMLGKMGAV